MRRYHGCRVPGCRAAHYSKGYCRRHLNAFERGRIVTGENLREFRRDQNWNQEKFSSLLSISKSYLQSLETSRGPLSDEISAAFHGLQRLCADGEIKSDKGKPQRRFQDFRRSVNFSQEPPFASLPACTCGDVRCRLSPVTDGEWDERHLWKFQGKRCHRIRYVNAQGKIVPIPRELSRDPLLQKPCSQCGQLRQLDRRYRSVIGGNVVTLHCVPRAGDSLDQKHDPPERFIERNGEVRPLRKEDEDKLRGRSKTDFPVPVCALVGCPRRGKRMERTADLRRPDKNGKTWGLTMYACRPPRPATAHYEYRVLPHGEIARPSVNSAGKIEEGRYRWTDAKTGEVHETVRKKRAVRKDRVMPDAKCPQHGCALIQRRGPWRRGKDKLWLAVCSRGGERYHVDSKGVVSSPGKGPKRRAGRPRGISPEMQKRIRSAAAFLVCGWSIRKMAPYLFPDKPQSAESNAYRTFHEYRPAIASARATLSLTDARTIVEGATHPPSKNS